MAPQQPLSKPVICIVGPTASGKSELAQVLGEHFNGEIVSADSMQIYIGMDIGTGKVLSKDRRVPHYGLDLVQPGEAYSAALFQSYARDAITSIDSHNKQAIVCGGTGFYIRAALDDYRFPEGEQIDNPVRDRYKEMEQSLGPMAVWEELQRLDPESALIVHPNNVKRVIRALELHAQGLSYATQVQQLKSIAPYFETIFIGLSVDPEILKQRIDSRVDHMIQLGLVDEVRDLLAKGFREGITAPQAIGYKEIVSYLDKQCSLDESVQQIKQATKRYAKRQRSWFRQDSRIQWVSADSYDLEQLCIQSLEIIRESTRQD